jgi:dTMP kinase
VRRRTHGDRPGLWITFEGGEGSGKTTQLERLAARLDASGEVVVRTREPGGTALGRELRTILLRPAEQPMSPMAELMLYAADRAQHLHEVVLPALERGEIVLCDRFLDATLAYQGFGRGLGTDCVLELHRRPPLDRRPHRTILLDVDPEIALARARARDDERDAGRDEGRFEAEDLDFHRRVRDGYLALAREAPDRYRVVPAPGGPDAVEAAVLVALRDLPRLEGLLP